MKQFIKTSIKKIKGAIDSNKLVIFVGAGVSANSKCPSWNKLVDRFADELGIPEKDRSQSIEYFLKVPQYYYIERGEKEYFDIIDETINSFDPIPNDINRIIFKLNPCTIVTTNFDDLLEKTVKSEGLFYTTIKLDKDLPYCINDKLIIKMHGDGILKNIVLKEEDYLNYSSKFPLIENYVKGLFSTKTILFVGYSAEDPDFKLLFQWVKDQLKEHFQPAYLLETEKKEDRINFNYYKNRGINILYYDEISEEIDLSMKPNLKVDITHPLGIRLFKFLNFINEYKGETSSNIFDIMYSKLKVFEEMNAITPDDIVKVLDYGCRYDHLAINDLYFFRCDELLEIINKIKGKENKEEDVKNFKNELFKNANTMKVLKILSKASIENISVGHNDIVLSLERDLNVSGEAKSEQDEFYELYNTFNYSKLEEKLLHYLSDKEIEDNEYSFLKKAFYYYNLGHYLDAYEILKRVSTHSFSRRKYLYYFIAQFNIKQIANLIRFNEDMSDYDYYSTILEEIDSIDIQNKYTELPRQYKDKVGSIIKLESFNYFYKKVLDLYEKLKSLKGQKNTVNNGGFAFNNDIIRAYHDIGNVMKYINKNYITVYHFKEIRQLFSIFIEGVFINYSIINSENNKLGIMTTKVESLDVFTLDIILRYVKTNDLKDYIRENDIDTVAVENEGIEYLIDVLSKMSSIKQFKYNYNNVLDYNEVINNIFILLGYIKLEKEKFERIIREVIKIISCNIMDGTNFDNILNFIIRIFNNQKSSISVEVLVELLSNYVINLHNKKLNGFAHQVIFKDDFFGELSYICKNIDTTVKLSAQRELLYLISECIRNIEESKTLDDNTSNIVNNLMIPIYELMTESVVSDFLKLINLYLCTLQAQNNKYQYIRFKYTLLNRNIIKIENEEDKEFVRFTISFIEEKLRQENANSNKTVIEIRSGDLNVSEEAMILLLNLILSNKIDYSRIKDLCTNIEELFPMFKFFINRESFNYDKFDDKWIMYLRETDIEDMLKSKEGKERLLTFVSNQLDNKNARKTVIKKANLILKKLI